MASSLAVNVLFQWTLLLFCFYLCFGMPDDAPNKLLFSDKTSYHFLNQALVKPRKCRAVHLNMVIRHGSRYPAHSRVMRATKLLNKINPFFINNTFRYKGLSLPWSIPSDILNSASKELSQLGAQEMYLIAKRFFAKFPAVFKYGYSNENYSLVSTDKLRCSQSAVAFAHGIFEGRGNLGGGKYQPVAVKYSGPDTEDTVLRIYEACRKWKKIAAKTNPNSEYAKFMNGQEVRNVVQNITTRLNLTNKLKLRTGMVLEMFWLCAYGIQTDSADTSWCSIFQEEHLNVLEYLNDLKLYWERSYGRKINYEMACPLYKEITDSFERFFKNGKFHGVFRFAHTGTVTPLLTMLGLYNDSVPPRADNFDQQSNRKLRFSRVVPMSANVAFVLYDCSEKNTSDVNEADCVGQCGANNMAFNSSKMKVQLLVNEVAVPIPACNGEIFCSVEQFLSYYSYIRENCNIKAICGKRRRSCKKRNKNKPID